MYEQLHEKEQGNFESSYYWSSTVDDDLDFEDYEYESDEIQVFSWLFGFHNGHDIDDDKEHSYYVRAVRDL